ncbi:MAG: hypothetical protein LBU24_01780 [Methanocalculaceae archaeon]|jgi:uncharacterized membrane protein|nr:hypothetical protein [Methanocalculaceae archaeon]
MSIFAVISGTALVLRYGRMGTVSKHECHLAILKRGVQIFLVGVVIAAVGSLAVFFSSMTATTFCSTFCR